MLELSIDGALRQRGGTQHMLYPPSVILKEVQTFLPLEDGDIIMTGTPAGVGPIETGATFTGRILDGEREARQCTMDCALSRRSTLKAAKVIAQCVDLLLLGRKRRHESIGVR